MQCAILVNGDVKYTRKLMDSAFFREIEGFGIVGMVASAPDAQALTRARNLHVPTFVVEEKLFPNGNSYGVALLNKLKDIDSDFVVADGMIPVPPCVCKHYNGRLLRVKLTPVGQTMEIAAYLSDAAGGVERSFVPGTFEHFDQSGKEFVKGIVRRPDFCVRRELFEQSELVGRIRGQEPFTPDGGIAAPFVLRTVVRRADGHEFMRDAFRFQLKTAQFPDHVREFGFI